MVSENILHVKATCVESENILHGNLHAWNQRIFYLEIYIEAENLAFFPFDQRTILNGQFHEIREHRYFTDFYIEREN